MSQTNAKEPITLAIHALSYGTYGIGRQNGKAVMVPNTVPGDRILARTVQAKDRYDIGELVRVIDPSPDRQDPPCRYVTECGGCPWQHIRYDAQLKAKRQNVDDALRRIGKLRDFEVRPIISSPDEYHYRRRVRFQLNEKREFGFYRSGSRDLVSVESCLIADNRIADALPAIREWAQRLTAPPEYIEVITGDEPAQLVVNARTAATITAEDERACESLTAEAAVVGSLILHNPQVRKRWGETKVSISLPDGLSLCIEADVFSQVNPRANLALIHELLKAGNFTRDDHVLDLYCGAGNFTLPVARCVRDVVAVEGSRGAIESGQYSAHLNRVQNIRWLHGPVPDVLRQLRARQEFSKVILDPPRTGARDIETDLASLLPEKILYVSCDPATLARDIAGLARRGYGLEFVQPIDLFPHTFHVETLALITRSN